MKQKAFRVLLEATLYRKVIHSGILGVVFFKIPNFYFFFFFPTEVSLTWNTLSVSGVQHNDLIFVYTVK